MSSPTFPNVLYSALTSSFKQSLISSSTHPFSVEVKNIKECEADVEESLKKLQAQVAALHKAVEELKKDHQGRWRYILIYIDLRFAFHSEQPIAKLLRCCGVENPAALSQHEAKTLHPKLVQENRKQPLVEKVPSSAIVESWIHAARLAAE
ncbi:MAG: hypothetical protein H6R26_1451 [Proteobacteria bacterium]|nr:hypothetical protein [Pseudomonadota bacterium]